MHKVMEEGPKDDKEESHHKLQHHSLPKHHFGYLLYKACHEDRIKYCPNLHGPFCPKKLLRTDCFKNNLHKMSTQCQTLIQKAKILMKNHKHCKMLIHRFKKAWKNLYHKHGIAVIIISVSVVATTILSIGIMSIIYYRRRRIAYQRIQDEIENEELVSSSKLIFMSFEPRKRGYEPLPTDHFLPQYEK